MKNIFEDEEEQGPGSWIAADKDIVVTPEAPSTVEDAVKALENKDNYGIYLSNIRTGKLTPKDMEEFFGPSSPRAKQKIEKEKAAEKNKVIPSKTITETKTVNTLLPPAKTNLQKTNTVVNTNTNN